MKISVITLVMTSFFFLSFADEPVQPDLFPIADGNYWEFETRTGTTTYKIIGNKGDSILLEKSVSSQGYAYTYTLHIVSHDSDGCANYPCYRDLGGFWSPHVAVVPKNQIKTEAGTFTSSLLYPVVWGHPSGGNYSLISSPGVGPVALALTDLFSAEPDTFGLLKRFNVLKVPEGYSHTYDISNVFDENGYTFEFSPLGKDSGSLSFTMRGSACEKFLVSTSYNHLEKCLRIYVCDTAAYGCDNTQIWKHTVKLRNLSEETYKIKIFKGYFDTTIHISTQKHNFVKTSFLEDSISLHPSKIRKQVSSKFKNSQSHTIFNIQGRYVGTFLNLNSIKAKRLKAGNIYIIETNRKLQKKTQFIDY